MDLSEINQKLQNIRRKPANHPLRKDIIKANPFEQFVIWLNDELQSLIYDPCPMVLATVDENGFPDTRVVLLKELDQEKLIFYTNYASKKARDLEKNNVVSLNFYWQEMARQIRIRGRAEKVTRAKSEAYFATRPRESQLSVHAWIQSSKLPNREAMDEKMAAVAKEFADLPIPCPITWGGYAVTPFEYEFFQGRSWRLHDRILYTLKDNNWQVTRLAP